MGKVKMKNDLTANVMKDIELKIISKSLTQNPYNHFLKTKVFKLRKYIRA